MLKMISLQSNKLYLKQKKKYKIQNLISVLSENKDEFENLKQAFIYTDTFVNKLKPPNEK